MAAPLRICSYVHYIRSGLVFLQKFCKSLPPNNFRVRAAGVENAHFQPCLKYAARSAAARAGVGPFHFIDAHAAEHRNLHPPRQLAAKFTAL